MRRLRGVKISQRTHPKSAAVPSASRWKAGTFSPASISTVGDRSSARSRSPTRRSIELAPDRASLEGELVAAARHAAAEDQVVERLRERPLHAAPILAGRAARKRRVEVGAERTEGPASEGRDRRLDCAGLDVPVSSSASRSPSGWAARCSSSSRRPSSSDGVASRDAAGGVFGEILRRFEIVKQALSLAARDRRVRHARARRALSGAAVVAAVAIFVAIATNVYLAMVLRPRMGYFRRQGRLVRRGGAGRPLEGPLRPAAPPVDPRPDARLGGRDRRPRALALSRPVGAQPRSRAIASISTAAPLGSSATATVERAGRWFPKRRP